MSGRPHAEILGHLTTVPRKVLYYSNDILAKSLPKFGAYISVGITVINVIMTFPPVILIEVCMAIASPYPC